MTTSVEMFFLSGQTAALCPLDQRLRDPNSAQLIASCFTKFPLIG